MRETETAVCPRCGHGIDGRSRHPPECAKCPEGYCEATADPGDPASATLAAIRGLISARDDLAAHVDWDDPAAVSEFNAAQDKLAARVPLLLAAIEAVLELADEWNALWPCSAQVREAITAALAGTGKERSEDG